MSGARSLGRLRTGMARVDITPSRPLELSGFVAREGPAQGVHDPLYVRALALGSGPDRLILLVFDLIGVSSALTRRVRAEVNRVTGVPPERIGLLATHTHGAPAVLERARLGSVDEDYLQLVIRRAGEAAAQALASGQSCRVEHLTASETTVAKNRRDPHGPRDFDLPVLLFRTAPGDPLGALVSYACHPVVLGADNRLVTRDYPGPLVDGLEERLPGCTVIFATGCAGQVNTGHRAYDSWSASASPARTFEEAERIGSLLARRAREAIERAEPGGADTELVPRVATQKLQLPLQPPATGGLDVELTAVGLGDFALALYPGEPFVEYGLQLKERFPGRVVTLGYANGAPGYLPTRAALSEGGYEVEVAHEFYGAAGPVSPTAEELLTGAMTRLVAQVLP